MVMMIGMMMTVMTLMIELMMMILTSQVMEGNSNTYLAAKQELSPVIIASKVIIIIGHNRLQGDQVIFFETISVSHVFLLFSCPLFFLLENILLGDEQCLKLWLRRKLVGQVGEIRKRGGLENHKFSNFKETRFFVPANYII